MSIHTDVQHAMWDATVPLVITLYPPDLTDYIVPKPLQLTVPRMILWSSVISLVHSHFHRQTTPTLNAVYHPYDNQFLLTANPLLESMVKVLDLAEVQTPVWLEGPGHTVIDWRTPVGVTVDLWQSTAVKNNYLAKPASLPFKITAHFTKLPGKLPPCNLVVCRGWLKQGASGSPSPTNQGLQNSASGTTPAPSGNVTSGNNNSNPQQQQTGPTPTGPAAGGKQDQGINQMLPVFLQLPSSTHIATSLSRAVAASSILYGNPQYMKSLSTSLMSLFVTALYSNVNSEIAQPLLSCDCVECSNFQRNLTGAQQQLALLAQHDSSILDTPTPEQQTYTVTKEREMYASLMKYARPSSLTCHLTRLLLLTRSLCGSLHGFEKALKKLETEACDAHRRRAERLEAQIKNDAVQSNHGIDTAQGGDAPSELNVSLPSFNDEEMKKAVASAKTDTMTEIVTVEQTNGLWKSHHLHLPLRLYCTQHLSVLNGTPSKYVQLTTTVEPSSTGKDKEGVDTKAGPASTRSAQTEETQFEVGWTLHRQVPKLNIRLSTLTPQQWMSILQLLSSSPNYKQFQHYTDAVPPSLSNLHVTQHLPQDDAAVQTAAMSSGLNSPNLQHFPYKLMTVEHLAKLLMPRYHYAYGKSPVQLQLEMQQFQLQELNNDISLAKKAADEEEEQEPEAPEGMQPDAPESDSVEPELSPATRLAFQQKSIVFVSHGIAIPYDTPLIWLYYHMRQADLMLNIVIALETDLPGQ